MSSVSPSLPSETVSWRERANERLEAWIEGYCRSSRPERDGKLYERLGLRPVYLKVAALFGDPVLPTAREVRAGHHGDLPPARVKELVADSGYYEIVNLIYCIAYLPLLVYLTLQKKKWLLIYGLGWLCVHALCVVLERYKRALGRVWLEDYRQRGEPPPPPTDETPTSAFPVWLNGTYFRAYPVETTKLYRGMGTERFRLFVVWLKQMTTQNTEPDRPKQRIRYIEGITPNHIEQFVEDTRVSEVTHVVGTLTLVPFLIVFAQEGATIGIVTLVPLFWGNIYSTLLQRYHRVRVARIRQRRRSQSKQ